MNSPNVLPFYAAGLVLLLSSCTHLQADIPNLSYRNIASANAYEPMPAGFGDDGSMALGEIPRIWTPESASIKSLVEGSSRGFQKDPSVELFCKAAAGMDGHADVFPGHSFIAAANSYSPTMSKDNFYFDSATDWGRENRFIEISIFGYSQSEQFRSLAGNISPVTLSEDWSLRNLSEKTGEDYFNSSFTSSESATSALYNSTAQNIGISFICSALESALAEKIKSPTQCAAAARLLITKQQPFTMKAASAALRMSPEEVKIFISNPDIAKALQLLVKRNFSPYRLKIGDGSEHALFELAYRGSKNLPWWTDTGNFDFASYRVSSVRSIDVDLMEDFQRALLLVNPSMGKKRASELAWVIFGVYGTSGLNLSYFKPDDGFGIFDDKSRALSPGFISSYGLALVLNEAMLQEALRRGSSNSYIYPKGFKTSCMMGRPYHFWQSAFLSRIARQNGFDEISTLLAIQALRIGYYFSTPYGEGKAALDFKNADTIRLNGYFLETKKSIAFGMAGAIFGWKAANSDEAEGRSWISGIDFDSYLARYAASHGSNVKKIDLPIATRLVLNPKWTDFWVENVAPVEALGLALDAL